MSRAVRSKPSTQPQPASLIPKGTIAPLVCIAAVLGIGAGTATVWTCDLTHRYIEINADYRS